MKPLGIKAKVALATSITSMVMIGLVTVMQIERMRDDFTRVLFAQQTALINRTAEELDDKLEMLVDVLALTAKKQPPELFATPDKLRAYYSERATLALFDDIILVDASGKVVSDVPQVPGRVGVDASDREYFKRVMLTRKPVISDPVRGRTGKQPIVQIAAPVLDKDGNVAGIVLGVLRLYRDNVLGHLRTAKVGESGYYFAITRGENPIYVLYPDLARLLQPRPKNANPGTTRALVEGFEGTVLTTNSSGLRALTSFKALKSVDWILAAVLPADEAFEPFNGVLYRLAMWGLLASLAAAALIGWLTMRMLSPLVRLNQAIATLRQEPSRFEPLPPGKQDEIGQLTASFNELMKERLIADARLNSVIEYAPHAVMLVAGDGRIETFNRQAEHFFGYRRQEIIGRQLETLTPERFRGNRSGNKQLFLMARGGTEPVIMGGELDLFGLRQDGSEFPMELSLSAVRSDQDSKVLAVVSDITARYRLQEEVEARAVELEEERDRAEAANRAKSDFVANMSHEIRTPLNAVLGMAYLLGNTPLTTEQRKYLTMVRVAGESLLGILNDVLDFSKIEARRMELAPVDFDLDELMNTLGTTMTMNAGEKELELAIAVESDVPKRLHGDALRLQQILVNLAGNAIKFTAAGEVVVAVRLERLLEAAPAEDGGSGARRALLRFEVSDTGIGMSAQQQSQLFSAFSQGDESITRRFGGTGLGLVITKHLIQMMGGQIALRSGEGEGSSFWFSLPFEILPEAATERRRPALGNLRLLVADDNQTSRQLIGKLIKAWGWLADEVDSGAAALSLYRQRLASAQPYDVVLADWHMPGMNGLAMAKEIRSAAAGSKQPIVVMVNAFARDRLTEISSAAEADVVLMKPITSSNLFDALHQALIAKEQDGDEHAVPNEDIAGRLAGAHFLLVEDNLLNQAVARGILEHAGATLDVVGDGLQAVEQLRNGSRHYDIVLMDMQMPVLDGFSATRIIRDELKLTLPVIAMTAGVLESERDRCMDAGISDFIAKPVVVGEMMAVIERYLPQPAAAPVALVATAEVEPEAVFSMDKLMRVMGNDSKGREVLLKIVREALGNGMEPLRLAGAALAEQRYGDAARLFHGLRGSVGIMGTKRLIEAAQRFEHAVQEERHEALPALLAGTEAELALVMQQAAAWLAGIEKEQAATR